MVEKTLSDLLLAQLKDIYYAEKKILWTTLSRCATVTFRVRKQP